ncbi:MAG: cache domain-containing protein [Bryobacteraceae bacterium]
MRADDISVRVPVKKLLIGLSLTAVPLSILGVYIVNRADREIREVMERNCETIAASSASRISNYVHDRVIQVGALAQMPTVVDAVTAANRASAGINDAAFQEKVNRIEKVWSTPAAEEMVKQMLGSEAARVLRSQVAADRRLLRITLTDGRGAVIGATHKTLDYYQADEDFWQKIHAQGRGALNLTDILYDEVTKANYIGIGVPVMDPATNTFIGALDVLMELSMIFPDAATRQAGSSMQMMLVKQDGTVITGPGTTLSMNVKAPEWQALTSTGASLPLAGSQTLRLPGGGEKLVAYADTGLRGDYQNLAWSVLVAQDSREALAPTRAIVRLSFFFMLAAVVALALLAVYFSLRRTVHYEDVTDPMEQQGVKPQAKE